MLRSIAPALVVLLAGCLAPGSEDDAPASTRTALFSCIRSLPGVTAAGEPKADTRSGSEEVLSRRRNELHSCPTVYAVGLANAAIGVSVEEEDPPADGALFIEAVPLHFTSGVSPQFD